MLRALKRRLVRLLLGELMHDVKAIARTLDQMSERDRLARKWRRRTGQKLDALLRREYLADFLGGEYPFEVLARRFGLFSQNEEDGMILALLHTAGVATRRFAEIGSGASGGNSGLLAHEFGWRGLMVDYDAASAAKCAERFADGERVRCLHREVTPGNIDALLSEHGLAGEIDFFSLDIDSYDYWVLEAMRASSPRVMVLEYNAHFGPVEAVTVPPDAPLQGSPKGYHGASLAALAKLAGAKGYRLLACDQSGTNAFFMRDDLRPEIAAVPPAQAFRTALVRTNPLDDEPRTRVDLFQIAKDRGLPLTYV